MTFAIERGAGRVSRARAAWRPGAATSFIRRLATALLCCVGLLQAAPASAEVLDELQLLRAGDDAIVRIRFSVRIQYLRNLPLGNDGVDVFFQFGGATSPILADEQLRINESPGFPGVTVSLPLQQRAGAPARLNVRFTRPVKLVVRPFGANAIDVVVTGLGSRVSAVRVGPAAALPPVPDDQRFAVRLQTFASSDMPDAKPVPREFQEFTAFTSQSMANGRPVYELMLGYFASAADAEGARRRLTARFPDAQVIDLAQRRADALAAAAAAARAATATVAPQVPPVATAPALPVPAPAVPVPAVPVPSVPLPAVPSPAPAPATTPPPAAAGALPAVRAPEEIERQAAELMKKARAALDAKAPQDAVDSLNQLLTLPPNSQSEAAQELIGQARERNGEIAKARAEYALYLKLFPTGAGAERVRQRLAQLAAPAQTAATAPAARRERPPLKTLNGSFSQYYFGGKTRIENVFNTPTSQDRSTFSGVDQSLLLSTLDLVGRYRSGDSEHRVVLRDSYNLSFLEDRDSYNRLNAAYYDYRGLSGGLSARLGRQSGLGAGLPGRFDGGVIGYGSQRTRLNLAAGEPVEFTKFDSNRRFVNMNLELGGLVEYWQGNLFGIYQEVDGIVDRQAGGVEIRYVDGVRSLYALGDYDTGFKALNAASVQGSWVTTGGTSLNLLWDRRRAPTLSTTNAILGQPTTSIRTLLQTSTEQALRDAALRITAIATQGLVGLTTPVTERWQIGGDVRFINVGALPEVVVNGLTIPAQPATGDIISYSLQAIGTRLYSPRDSNVWSVIYSNAPTYDGWLVAYNNVTHLSDRITFEPSLRFYTQSDTAETKLVRIGPGLRLTWRPTLSSSIELDGLYEQTKTTSTNATDTARRYFYSLGYRLDL